jgi:Tol biopolymer transport system component
LAVSATLLAQAPPPASPDVLLKAAMQKEQIDNDLPAAIGQYKTIVEKFPKDPAAARSLLQLAGILERQGDREGARATYARVISDFAAQPELVRQATTRRAALDEGPIDRIVAWPTSFGQAADAGLSSTGRYVSYVDMTTLDLHVRDLRTGQARRLTRLRQDGGFVEYSVASPDGRWVAFVASEKGDANRGLRVLPMSATPETQPRLLVRDAWASPKDWSPDSRHVLAVIGYTEGRRTIRRELALVSAANGAVRRLVTWSPPFGPSADSLVKVSPNGAFVGYHDRAAPDDPRPDLFVVSVPGGQVTPLLQEPGRETFVGWAPDGGHVIFLSDREGTRDLWALPVRAGKRIGDPVLLVRGFEGGPVGMTSSGALYYERSYENRALFVAGVDPEAGRLLEAPKAWVGDPQARAPRWSRDGASFAYLIEGHMAIRSVATGIARTIPLRLGYKWTYDWSPDGKTFAFRANSANGKQGIHLFDAETGDLRLLLEHEANKVGYYFPQFSPAGDAMGFCKEFFAGGPEPGLRAVVRRTLSNGAETEVLRLDPRHDRQVVVSAPEKHRYGCGLSPDGKHLVTPLMTSSTSALVVVDLTTGQRREVFRRDRVNAFSAREGVHWMPDGHALIANVSGATSNEPRALWWIPIDGREAKPIDIGLRTLVDDAFAIHPKGKQVAFVAGDPVASKTGGPRRELRVLERFLPHGRPR